MPTGRDFGWAAEGSRVGIRARLRKYWTLTKSLQTGLLLLTGLAGYMSCRCPVMHPLTLMGLALSLFMAIGGSTVLNMVYDRDIDALMERTCGRPLPAGSVDPRQGLLLGLSLSIAGAVLALAMGWLYGTIVIAGLFFNVVVYTLWLKRRTHWSIVWGGIAGGMPVLAGRTLGLGRIDGIGLLLALAVLLWIPTHILTFHMKYFEDYQRARIPTFPAAYGPAATRVVIAVSSVAAASAVAAAGIGIGMALGFLRLLVVMGAGLLLLAFSSVARPSERINFGLFKYASLYMMVSMLLMVVETV